MAAQRFKLIFILLVSSCAAANDLDAIKINNHLSACTAISKTEISTKNEIPVLRFDLEVKKPIAECGCKSALGYYTVHTANEAYKSYVLGGKIGLMTSGRKALPLAAEPRLINKKKLVVDISCAQPD